VIIVAAVALAAVAAFATWRYLSGVNDKAFQRAQLVTYFVADKDIERGLPGDRALSEHFIIKSSIPRKNYPGKAITDAKVLQGKVAVGNIAAGVPIVDGDFADARTAIVSFAQRIPKGHQAVTISVDQVRGVAGLIVPGDKVNLLVTLDTGTNAATSALLQNVQVLAVGTSAQLQPGESAAKPATATGQPVQTVVQNSGLITFSVPANEASKIVEAVSLGQIYLTLVPPDFSPAPVPVINRGNLFS
jgi:pilus assembly protein CpaB